MQPKERVEGIKRKRDDHDDRDQDDHKNESDAFHGSLTQEVSSEESLNQDKCLKREAIIITRERERKREKESCTVSFQMKIKMRCIRGDQAASDQECIKH